MGFLYEERYTYYESKKSKKCICHRTSFYSIFDMSSCRKPEIQNDLPKLIKIKWICDCFNKQWSKSHNYVYFIMFKQLLNWMLKIGKFKKNPTRYPWVLRLQNTCAIGCGRKTANKVFKAISTNWPCIKNTLSLKMFSTNIDNQRSILVTVQTGRNTYVPVRHLNQTSTTSTIAVEVYSWSSTTNVSMTVRASTSGKALMSMRNDWKSDFRTRDLKFDDTTMSLVQEWRNLCMKVSKGINCSHILI